MLLAGGIDRGSATSERGQWQWHLLVAYRWRFNIFAKFHTSLYMKKGEEENKADFNLGPARGSVLQVSHRRQSGAWHSLITLLFSAHFSVGRRRR